MGVLAACFLIGPGLPLKAAADPIDRLDQRAGAKAHYQPREYRTLTEWKQRRDQLRRQILAAAGLWPLPVRNPLNPWRYDLSDYGPYRVEKVRLETLPGLYLGGNLYTPRGPVRPRAAVMVAHGHWKHGRIHDSRDYSVPALCANLAAQGYVVFAWDMLGYNDTRQLPHSLGSSDAELLWGLNSLGLQLWNSIRVLDFLASLQEVDPRRVAVTGASGGAIQTILLAAVDDRIRASAPVSMVSANFQGDDDCEEAPGLRIGTNNVEIAALAAPRPMLLVSAAHDWTRDTPKVEFPAIQSIYRLYGQSSTVSNVHINGPHNFNRASRRAVYAFLARYLRRGRFAAPPVEITVANLHSKDLLLLPGLPEDAIARDGLLPWWRQEADRQTRALASDELRDRLKATLLVEWPFAVDLRERGKRTWLSAGPAAETVPVDWTPGRGSVAILVPPATHQVRLSDAAARKHLERGDSILRLEGSPQPPGDHNREYLTYHRSANARRVGEIVAAMAFAARSAPSATLVCPGSARDLCMLAAAVSPIPVALEVDPGYLPQTDTDVAREVFIPGFLRAGGLEVAARLLRENHSTMAVAAPAPVLQLARPSN
jgi:dienelactone hydrolase